MHADQAGTGDVAADNGARVSIAIDVTLPREHPLAMQFLPGLVGMQWWLDVALPDEGMTSNRPATVVGAVKLPDTLGGGVVLRMEIP